jgi:hypothetical protein
MQRNEAKSPLLQLPPEIRNMIWKHVFSDVAVILDIPMWSTVEKAYKVRDAAKIRQLLMIPGVCRHFYFELSRHIYALMTFVIVPSCPSYYYPLFEQAAVPWAARLLPGQRHAITKVVGWKFTTTTRFDKPVAVNATFWFKKVVELVELEGYANSAFLEKLLEHCMVGKNYWHLGRTRWLGRWVDLLSREDVGPI